MTHDLVEDLEPSVGVDEDDTTGEDGQTDADGVDDQALVGHVGVVGQAEQGLLRQA